MNEVEKIVFSKNDEGTLLIEFFHGNDAVRYTIYSAEEVFDILYLMPKCLSADLEAKNMTIGEKTCEVEYGPGCEAVAQVSPEQTHAIFRVLALPDTPSDLDVLVQAIQKCL